MRRNIQGQRNISNLGWELWNRNTLKTNLMIPDFPHIMKILLAPLIFFFLRHDFAKSLPCWLFQFNSNQVEMDEGSSWALVRKKWQLGSPVWRCPWIPAPLHWLWELVTSDKIQRAHYSRATVIGQFLEARLVMELFQRLTHTMNLHWPENRKFLLTYYGHKYVVRSNLRRNCVINP